MDIVKKSGFCRTAAVMLAVAAAIVFCFPFNMADAEAASAGGTVTADSYDMTVDLDTQNNAVDESVTLKLTNRTGGYLDRICIRNTAASVIKYDAAHVDEYRAENSLKKSTVTGISNASTNADLKYTVGSDPSVIYAELGSEPLAAGASLTLLIRVKTDIPRRDDRFGYHKNRYGKLYNLSFCFPSLAAYKNGKWNESPYFDIGENRCAECTDYDVTFKAPQEYRVAASGTETTSAPGITSIKARNMRDFAVTACNFMKKKTTRAAGVKINTYYLKCNKKSTYKKFAAASAGDSIREFTKAFGRYPYKELDVMQDWLGGNGDGMEYPGLVMIDGSGFISSRGARRSSAEELVSTDVHEVGHEWFYAVVGNDEYREAWLDEGFATFCEEPVYSFHYSPSLAAAEKHDGVTLKKSDLGDRAINRYLKTGALKYMPKRCSINRPYNKFKNDEAYEIAVYERGAVFIWQLRIAMGKKKFSAAMHKYYRTYKFKTADTRGFLKIIKKYSHSKKVKKVIRRYINNKYL